MLGQNPASSETANDQWRNPAPDLKPCLRCGSTKLPAEVNLLPLGHVLRCQDCALDAGGSTRAEACEKWNRRAPSPAVREVVNRFKALSRWPSFKMRYTKLYAALERLAKEIEA
jgi:hypothetical protein